MSEKSSRANQTAEVRSGLIDALNLDLIGPTRRISRKYGREYEEEILPIAPTKWYLTGFLAPQNAAPNERYDESEVETLDEVSEQAANETQNKENITIKSYFPSSIGLSVLVPKETTELIAEISWGKYRKIKPDLLTNLAVKTQFQDGVWQRTAHKARIHLSLKKSQQSVLYKILGHKELELVVTVRETHAIHVEEKSRTVAIFFVNRYAFIKDLEKRDENYVFQPELTLKTSSYFIARPQAYRSINADWDEQVADLQYRNVFTFAVGHNVASVAKTDDSKKCTSVRTTWIPLAEVKKVEPKKLENVMLDMQELAQDRFVGLFSHDVTGSMKKNGRLSRCSNRPT